MFCVTSPDLHQVEMMYFFTASDLHPVDMGWASSMSITLRELEPKQKLLSLMNWLKWCIFLPPLTSNQWTWGGPPPWLSPWQAWNQNKSCLAWWTDYFDVFLTASDLHLVDMGWASSMVITLARLEPKQKLVGLMYWVWKCILIFVFSRSNPIL